MASKMLQASVALPAIGAVLVLSVFYIVYKVIYNLYFHPLAKFPGPKLAAVSDLYYAIYWPAGRWPFQLEELHKKYGDVVRYAPNDVDFATAQAFQDIHGHIKQGRQTFLKGSFYNRNGDPGELGIVSERDPLKHREIRKSLSHAFSAKSLRTQTDVVLYYVGMWVEQLKRFGNTEEGVNADEWYNWITFDIIGDLAFGSSFDAVKNAKGHPWVNTLKQSLHASLFPDVFRRVPLLKIWPTLVMPVGISSERKEHFRLSGEKVKQRQLMPNDRDDFFSHLLSEKATNISHEFLTAQANTLIVAGSETTATFLIGVTFYLLKNPSTLYNLTQEIRTAFQSPDMIDGDSTQSLPYLFAVIEEGLRIYPPVPSGLYRTSPGAMVDGHFVPAGSNVSANFWTMSHSERYFHRAREFHPERWLPEKHPLWDLAFKNDNKDASKPFLVGPRACLGINLAYMEMRIILSRLVWEFDLELISKEVDWERDNVLRLLWQKPQMKVRFLPAAR